MRRRSRVGLKNTAMLGFLGSGMVRPGALCWWEWLGALCRLFGSPLHGFQAGDKRGLIGISRADTAGQARRFGNEGVFAGAPANHDQMGQLGVWRQMASFLSWERENERCVRMGYRTNGSSPGASSSAGKHWPAWPARVGLCQRGQR